MCMSIQVREHTSHLEAELEKHMAAASAECQNYAKEVAGVSAHSTDLYALPSQVWVLPSGSSSALRELFLSS